MNFALWIVQGVLALGFLLAGSMKLTQPREKEAQQMDWVSDFSTRAIRTIGTLEVLAAIGLILPSVTGILPWVTPLAAVGLVLLMLGAAATHRRRGEMPMIGVNAVLLALAAFVAYGRFFVEPL